MTTDPALIHPMIRLHVVDMTTGQYLERELPRDPEPVREGEPSEWEKLPVTTTYETSTVLYQKEKGEGGKSNRGSPPPSPRSPRGGDEEKAGEEGGPAPKIDSAPVGRVLPVATKPCPLRSRGALPSWNGELLVLNENYRTFLHPKCLMLFEIVDFGPSVTPPRARDNQGLAGACFLLLLLLLLIIPFSYFSHFCPLSSIPHLPVPRFQESLGAFFGLWEPTDK